MSKPSMYDSFHLSDYWAGHTKPPIKKKDKKPWLFRILFLICIALLLYFIPGIVWSDEGGFNGYLSNPEQYGEQNCSACHVDGETPYVMITGDTTVLPNSSNIYTVTLTGGQGIEGSLNVSATGGIFYITNSDVMYLDSQSGELYRQLPFEEFNSTIEWTFEWQAPAEPGTYIIYVAGHTFDNDGTSYGDSTDFALITINVLPHVTLAKLNF